MAANSVWLAMTDEERSRVRRNAPMVRKERRAAALSNAASARPNVIIDLAFDQFMTDQQVASLARQLCLCHAASKRSQPAITYCLSSYGGRLERQVGRIHGSSAWPVAMHRRAFLDVANAYPGGSARLVYLSAEGEETLSSFDPESIYIIGGLVDRNRHKGLTYRRAQAAGVRTARLPLDEHITLKNADALGRAGALTVNHCFEMLTQRAQGRTWEDAILDVMPRRRGAVPRDHEPATLSDCPLSCDDLHARIL